MTDSAKPFGTCFAATEERKSGRTLRVLLLVHIILNAYNFHIILPQPGIDPSWIFSLNYAVNCHLLFGRDVVSTCGPLGFLIWPQPVGSNVLIALICHLGIWLIFSGVLCFAAARRLFSLDQLFLFAITMVLCGEMSFDYSIGFLVLFLLCFSLTLKNWLPWFLLANLLTPALFFMKFTSALLVLPAIMLLSFTQVIANRNRGVLQLGLSLILIPSLFAGGYLLYNPSITDMFAYLRGSFEITSGYSVGMSIPGKWYEIFFAFIFASVYFYVSIQLYMARQSSFWMSIAFVSVLFLGFKHGFVRQDGHVIIYFQICLFALCMLMLFSDLHATLLRPLKYIYPILFIICFFIYQQHFHSILLTRIVPVGPVKNIINLFTQSKIDRTTVLKLDTLPETIMAEIGRSKVGVFPSEISYVAANNLNYSPLPAFQSYFACTSYLDNLSAAFLSGLKGPLYLLVDFQSIDGRHCLIDVPSTWLSIYKWYEPRLSSESVLLLRKREAPRFEGIEPAGAAEYHKTDSVLLPESTGPVLVRISLDLTRAGRMAKTFYKILPVEMALIDDAGGVSVFRVIPDTLKDGIFLNYLPMDLHELDLLLNGKAARKICSFELLGNGLKMYQDKMSVQFIRIPGVEIGRLFEDLSFPEGIRECPGKTTFNIDSTEPGWTKKGKKIVVTNERFITVRGWAVDDEAQDAGGGMWADIDAKSYAGLRSQYPDIAVRFDRKAFQNAGFTVGINVSQLSPGLHELSLKILAKNVKCYYQSQPIILEIKAK